MDRVEIVLFAVVALLFWAVHIAALLFDRRAFGHPDYREEWRP